MIIGRLIFVVVRKGSSGNLEITAFASAEPEEEVTITEQEIPGIG